MTVLTLLVVFGDLPESSAHFQKQDSINQVAAQLHTALLSAMETFAPFLLIDPFHVEEKGAWFRQIRATGSYKRSY
jgi:hypothetical protein